MSTEELKYIGWGRMGNRAAQLEDSLLDYIVEKSGDDQEERNNTIETLRELSKLAGKVIIFDQLAPDLEQPTS